MNESMSGEYAKALEAHNTAVADFTQAQRAYRLRYIGDDEFLKARTAYAAASELFDEAYAKEAGI